LLSQIQESHREAKPLLLIHPLPLDKGKGIKGIGLPLNRGEAPLNPPSHGYFVKGLKGIKGEGLVNNLYKLPLINNNRAKS
jgi:hypothetical protein